MSRRKFTSKFKTKVVLEALKERESLADLAQKYELHPQQISTWKREFLQGAETVFDQDYPVLIDRILHEDKFPIKLIED